MITGSVLSAVIRTRRGHVKHNNNKQQFVMQTNIPLSPANTPRGLCKWACFFFYFKYDVKNPNKAEFMSSPISHSSRSYLKRNRGSGCGLHLIALLRHWRARPSASSVLRVKFSIHSLSSTDFRRCTCPIARGPPRCWWMDDCGITSSWKTNHPNGGGDEEHLAASRKRVQKTTTTPTLSSLSAGRWEILWS